MGTLTGRDPNSILNGCPTPVDARFEPIKNNMEMLSQYKSTKGAAKLKVAPRTELWGPPQAQPDFLNNKKTDKALF